MLRDLKRMSLKSLLIIVIIKTTTLGIALREKTTIILGIFTLVTINEKVDVKVIRNL